MSPIEQEQAQTPAIQNAQGKTIQATMHQLSLSPAIWWITNFLTDDECEHLKLLASGQMKRSLVVNPEDAGEILSEYRTSRSTFLPNSMDTPLKVIEARIATLLRIPVEYGEALQVLHYGPGEQYKPHHDYFDPEHPGTAKLIERDGQRVATVLMYLNDVEEGGETAFPMLNIKIKPQKGAALLFYNLHSNGLPDPNTLHASLPVIEGEKWVATKWLRERPYHPSAPLCKSNGLPQPVVSLEEVDASPQGLLKKLLFIKKHLF